MLVVCLTGGIGAGKSTAARILADLGAHVMSLDEIARAVLDPGSDGAREVERLWPSVVHDGVIDRALLAAIVFSDDDALHRLNSITHPRTWRAAELRLAQWEREDPRGIAIIELALLAQSPRKYSAHLNMVIAADPQVRIDRLVRLRAMSEADARGRIAKQSPQRDLVELADIWIENSAGETELRGELTRVWHKRLVPHAENLFAGCRLSGSAAAPDTAAIARIEARLAHQGVDVRPCAPESVPCAAAENLPFPPVDSGASCHLLVPGYDEAALHRAGFVPAGDEGRFILADPSYEFSVVAPEIV